MEKGISREEADYLGCDVSRWCMLRNVPSELTVFCHGSRTCMHACTRTCTHINTCPPCAPPIDGGSAELSEWL